MSSRIFFSAIVAFWVVMNFLLWRSQSGAHSQIGSAIPVRVVWEKILTAPDNSSLDIYDHDKKIGFGQWMTTIGNSSLAANKSLSEDYAPDGLTPEPSSYTLTFEGNTSLPGGNRVRFDSSLRLSTNETWQDFHLSARMKPAAWDVHAVAASGKIVIKINEGTGVFQQTMKLSDLEQPEGMLAEFGGPYLSGILGTTGAPAGKESISQIAGGLHWAAHDDWMKFGHSRVRVYRLEAQFLGQHLSLFVSRVGEILWVEAPNKITLRNEAFSHF